MLEGPAGISDGLRKPVRTHKHVRLTRRRTAVQCVAPHLLPRHDSGCRCNSCSTGLSREAWAGIDPSCGCECSDAEGAITIKLPVDQQDCPCGSIPWDVWQAKTNVLYEPVWKCFEWDTVAMLLDSYSNYQLCTSGGEWSVLLAATHFVQLHMRINPNFGMAASKQAALGRAVTPMHPAVLHNRGIINSNYGSNHWSMSTYGLEYQTLLKGPVALAGMAWGI